MATSLLSCVRGFDHQSHENREASTQAFQAHISIRLFASKEPGGKVKQYLSGMIYEKKKNIFFSTPLK